MTNFNFFGGTVQMVDPDNTIESSHQDYTMEKFHFDKHSLEFQRISFHLLREGHIYSQNLHQESHKRFRSHLMGK